MKSQMRCKPILLAPLLLLAGPGLALGQATSDERPLDEFSKLEVQNGIDIYVTQSDHNSLRLEVEGIDLDDVVVEVHGDTLTLSSEMAGVRSFYRKRQVTAYLDYKQLSAIRASGGSEIHGLNEVHEDRLSLEASGGSDLDLSVQAQSLEARLSGGSGIKLAGSAPSLVARASGGSDISARALDAERAELRLSGGSDAIVNVNQAIDLDLSGGSDIRVYGNPEQRKVNKDRSADISWE